MSLRDQFLKGRDTKGEEDNRKPLHLDTDHAEPLEAVADSLDVVDVFGDMERRATLREAATDQRPQPSLMRRPIVDGEAGGEAVDNRGSHDDSSAYGSDDLTDDLQVDDPTIDDIDTDPMPTAAEIRQGLKETRTFTTASGAERKLSGQQERFCELVAQGVKLADAYRAAYDTSKMKVDTVYQSASRLAKESHIAARVEALRAAEKGKAYSDGAFVRRFIVDNLMERVDKAEKDADKLKALQLLGELVHVKAFSKQTETINTHNFEGMNSTEMRAQLAKMLKKS